MTHLYNTRLLILWHLSDTNSSILKDSGTVLLSFPCLRMIVISKVVHVHLSDMVIQLISKINRNGFMMCPFWGTSFFII